MANTHIRIEGTVGRITLAREQALNALTYPMVTDIAAALERWRDDDRVKLVLVDAAGPRAFCAGGDVLEIYRRAQTGDLEYARRFWRDEYHLNALIGRYPKPYVALMHGITMGGGVGLSGHGSHRIVTDSTVLAMPEAAIGLLPDVGGTWLLGRATGSLGSYLAMSGERINAADAIYAGFADVFVPEAAVPKLVDALRDSGDVSHIHRFVSAPESGVLASRQQSIDDSFKYPSASVCLKALQNSNAPWAAEVSMAIERNSPLSVAISHEAVRRAKRFSCLEQSLALEFRFTYRSVQDSDFLEGVRAMLVDKDRTPRWQDTDLSAVASERVAQLLAPLGDQELWPADLDAAR